MTLHVGDRAPDFTLPAATGPSTDDGEGGSVLALSDLRGHATALYFYPKDDTSGCTREALAFRDALPDFAAAQTRIIGVSRDSIAKHDAFQAKHGLTFPLLSDSDGAACIAYGVWVEKRMYGRIYMGIERATFLIDGDGVLQQIWRKVKVPGHVEAVLAAAQALQRS